MSILNRGIQQCLSSDKSFFVLLFVIFSINLKAQCSGNVDAGDDIFICDTLLTIVDVEADISGTWLSFEWKPNEYFVDPYRVQTQAIITENRILEFCGTFITDHNLITNPDFEDGLNGYSNDPSYSTGYFDNGSIYQSLGPIASGANGSNNFLFQNTHCPGSFPAGSLVAGQTIPNIIPNQLYECCFWIVNLNQINTATVEMRMNNEIIGSGKGGPNGVWVEHCFQWNSGSNTSAFMGMYNLTGECYGNDFGIDEFVFNEICQTSDYINVFIDDTSLSLEAGNVINCLNSSTSISANINSFYSNFDFTWTTPDGTTMSNNSETINVEEGGTYTFSATNSETGCIFYEEIDVAIDTIPPNILNADPTTISCSGSVFLDATNNLLDPDQTFIWTTDDGQFISNQESLIPEVGAAGNYTLTIIDTLSGCESNATFEVIADLELPLAIATTDLQINCNNPSIFIDGSGSSEGSSFEYQWTTQDGNIISATNSLSLEVDMAGTYELLIINTENGCSSSIAVLVEEDFEEPQISIPSVDVINCSQSNVQLQIVPNDLSSIYEYSWSTLNGNILNGQGSTQIEVDQAGMYEVVITNIDNGCSTIESLDVFENTTLPLVDLGPDFLLTCSETDYQINGNTNLNDNYSIAWIGPNGNILPEFNSLDLLVNNSGQYSIIISDLSNGCTAMDEIEILQDTNLPIADIQNPQQINCYNQSFQLDANGSSFGSNYSISWSSTNGSILNGSSSLNPEINSAGTYTLTIINLENQCSSSADIIVQEDFNEPEIALPNINELNCTIGEVFIENLQHDSEQELEYLWLNSNGEIISTNQNININEAGLYSLQLTNLQNGCTSTSAFEINENIDPIEIIVDPLAILTCTQQSLVLDASLNSNNSNTSFIWSTSNGNIVSSASTLSPEINQAGTYELLVTNSENNCTSTATITVETDDSLPQIDIDQPSILNCNILEQSLLAESSDNLSLEFDWTTSNGNIVSGMDSNSPLIDEPGLYTVEVYNPQNGCVNVQSVEVLQDILIPLSSISSNGIINCKNDEVTLTIENVNNSEVEIEWQTFGGSSYPNESVLSVSEAGLYSAIISYLHNGCTAEVYIEVEENLSEPLAIIEEPNEINCENLQVNLNAENSSQGSDYQYNWTGPIGGIVSGEHSLNPLVSQAGIYTLTVIDNENGCETISTIEVWQNSSIPEFEIPDPDILNCSNNIVQLEPNIISNSSSLNFEWSNDSGVNLVNTTDNILEVNEPGIYDLIIWDTQNGCSQSQSVEVYQDLVAPVILIEAPDVLNCNRASVILNAIGSSQGEEFSYLWTNENGSYISNDESLNPEVTEVGNYILTITNNENQCSTQLDVNVDSDFAAPNISILEPEIIDCNNPSITIISETEISNSNYTYSWSTDSGILLAESNLENVLIGGAGEYLLTVLDNSNGCTAVSETVVLENFDEPFVILSFDQELNCIHTEVSLDGSLSSNGNQYEYLWTTVDGSILTDENGLSPTVDESGTYNLLILNQENGCTNSEEIYLPENIQEPEGLILEPEILTCEKLEVELNFNSSETNLNFNWGTNNGNILHQNGQGSINVNQAGTYSIQIIQLDNGCTNSYNIEVEQDIEAPLIDAGLGTTLTCDITEFTLSAESFGIRPISFNWSTDDGYIIEGQNTLKPLVNSAGTYTLIATNTENGCTASDELEMRMNDNLPFAINAISNPPACHGEQGSIEVLAIEGGEEPYLYSIDNGNTFLTEQIFENLNPGEYQILIQDSNGCQVQDYILIPNTPIIDLTLIPEIEIQLGQSAELIPQLFNIDPNDISEIRWSPTVGLSCTNCLEPISSATEETLYTVEIISKNGCPASAEILLKVDRDKSVYIPSGFSPFNQDGINDVFLIYAQENVVVNVQSFQIYDRWGNKVFEDANFEANDISHGWNGTYRKKKMNTGVFIYFALIEFADGSVELFKGDLSLIE